MPKSILSTIKKYCARQNGNDPCEKCEFVNGLYCLLETNPTGWDLRVILPKVRKIQKLAESTKTSTNNRIKARKARPKSLKSATS